MSHWRSFSPLIFAAAAATILSGIHGSLHYAFASVIMFAALCALTYPAVRFLTGTGVASVIFAVPVGLLLNSLGLSFFAWAGGFRIITLLVYVLFAGALSAICWKKIRNQQQPPEISWETSDSNHLLVWLIVVAAAVTPAFLNVGAETPQGYAFRAYFNTDVFRNMATAGSLVRTGISPENPYFAGFKLHYYWLFHVIPAFWMKVLPGYRPEFIFVQFAFVTALGFTAALWAVARSLSAASRRTTIYLLPLYLLGGSYEGLYVLQISGNESSMARIYRAQCGRHLALVGKTSTGGHSVSSTPLRSAASDCSDCLSARLPRLDAAHESCAAFIIAEPDFCRSRL